MMGEKNAQILCLRINASLDFNFSTNFLKSPHMSTKGKRKALRFKCSKYRFLKNILFPIIREQQDFKVGEAPSRPSPPTPVPQPSGIYLPNKANASPSTCMTASLHRGRCFPLGSCLVGGLFKIYLSWRWREYIYFLINVTFLVYSQHMQMLQTYTYYLSQKQGYQHYVNIT